ncbi:hypothetical protein ABKN59_007834 [Abortiporus biennis]
MPSSTKNTREMSSPSGFLASSFLGSSFTCTWTVDMEEIRIVIKRPIPKLQIGTVRANKRTPTVTSQGP